MFHFLLLRFPKDSYGGDDIDNTDWPSRVFFKGEPSSLESHRKFGEDQPAGVSQPRLEEACEVSQAQTNGK